MSKIFYKIGTFLDDGYGGKLSPGKAFWLFYWVWGTILNILIGLIFDYGFGDYKIKYILMLGAYIGITEGTWLCTNVLENSDIRKISIRIIIGLMIVIYTFAFWKYMGWL